MSRSIDMLIIGGHKSGTTSLARYVAAHPEIYMPAQKEISFFFDDSKFARGMDWYLEEWFSSAGSARCRGEASVGYMRYEHVPQRIHSLAPEVKLVAILRNPVERAYSHYRMAARRQVEDRPFSDCVKSLLDRGRVPDDQMLVRNWESLEYVMSGEYGRLLTNYLRYFPREQLKLVFFEDMVTDPGQTVSDVFRFLGVAPDFRPDDLGRIYHKGGTGRLPWFEKANKQVHHFLGRIPGLRWAYETMLPRRVRTGYRSLRFWLNTEWNVKPSQDDGPTHESRRLLLDHYRSDVELLSQNFDVSPPWDFDTGKRETKAA